jgi:hypothetical protein
VTVCEGDGAGGDVGAEPGLQTQPAGVQVDATGADRAAEPDRGLVKGREAAVLDRFQVAFDDGRAVATRVCCCRRRWR